MTIDITCPSCEAKYRVKDELAGRKGQCKKCGAEIQIGKPKIDPYAMYVDDDDESATPKLAEPALQPTDKPTEKAAEPSGSATGDECPMCHATLMADAEMCMSCGYEFGGSSLPRDETDAEKERREAELREQIPESIASRLARWTLKTIFVAMTIGMIGCGVWWVMGFVQQSSGHGRIDKLVKSAQAKDAVIENLSAELAADVVYLPSYLKDLSTRTDRAKKTNIELEGLEYVDSADNPRFDLKFTKQVVSLQSPVAADAPDAWRDAAAVSTLIVNLPEDIDLPKDCDITALMQVDDMIGLPAAMQLFRKRKDLDWQLEHSCAADDRVRRFAARLLIARLNTTADSAASLDLLSQRTAVAEKQKSFEILQAEHGAIP